MFANFLMGRLIFSLFAFGLAEVPPPCDMSLPSDLVCEAFCTSKCSFYNASQGEDGRPKIIKLYRLTPANVTGIRNKDTGDAPGDVTFYLSKKNLTQQCAQDPTSFGCFLDGENLYGEFNVEMSTQWGPYFECNPMNVGKIPWKPDWIDTRDFVCGQDCLIPHADTCLNFTPHHNGTSPQTGGMQCWCDGTGRHNKTVGREVAPLSRVDKFGPEWWPPQCYLGYEQATVGRSRKAQCVTGTAYRSLEGWSFESVLTMACEACDKDPECEGWATSDNRTVKLFKGKFLPSSTNCIGGVKHHSKYQSWGSAGQVGGMWYSTPITAECLPGQEIGFNGCSWRVVSAKYKNASCIDRLVDDKVEEHGMNCFSACAQPLNRTGDCYLSCYRNTLLGDASFNVSAMTNEQIIGPWQHGFEEDDPKKGGCPEVKPQPCEGPQCGDRPSTESLVV
jgi:hypothetical protein